MSIDSKAITKPTEAKVINTAHLKAATNNTFNADVVVPIGILNHYLLFLGRIVSSKLALVCSLC